MNVLLDLDGTLTDPRDGILGCICYALDAMGHAVPADPILEQYIGPPLRETFRDLLDRNDDAMIEAAVATYRERFATIGLYENRVYEGIPEALERLSASGAQLYVATTKPWRFAEQILEHFNLSQFIRSVYGSELDGTRSDKRELIHHVLRSENLDVARTVMVGDRHQDVTGALHNDVLPIGVLWGYGSAQELSDAGARRLLEAPEQLAAILAL